MQIDASAVQTSEQASSQQLAEQPTNIGAATVAQASGLYQTKPLLNVPLRAGCGK